MQKVAQFLLFASRGLAICAVLAGIGVGFLEATIGATFVCFDSCPTREFLFSNLGPGTALQPLLPCIVLELLALVAFVAYCLATGQARRVAMPILFLLVGGLVGVAGLYALLQHAATTLPVDQDGTVIPESAKAWATLGGCPSCLSPARGQECWPTCNGAAERHWLHHGPLVFANDKTPDRTSSQSSLKLGTLARGLLLLRMVDVS